MKAIDLVVVVGLAMLIGCGKSQRDEQQDKLDRAIESAGGIKRDRDNRPYTQTSTGDRKYLDQGGSPRPKASGPVAEAIAAEAAGDGKRAAALYEKACDAGVLEGCGRLSLLLHIGIAIPEDRKRSEQLATKACDGKDPSGCFTLAVIRETTGKSDEAMKLYTQSCDAELADACHELAMIFHSGRMDPKGAKDRDKAVTFLEKACKLGDQTSCMQIDMVRSGK